MFRVCAGAFGSGLPLESQAVPSIVAACGVWPAAAAVADGSALSATATDSVNTAIFIVTSVRFGRAELLASNLRSGARTSLMPDRRAKRNASQGSAFPLREIRITRATNVDLSAT